jgi:Zn-dependent M28 family amino/carboxypeptidase
MVNPNRTALTRLCALILTATLAGTPVALASDAADQAMAAIHAEAIRADLRFLSDDLLEGRGTATRGYQIAAKFMATQLEGLGLQPAGDAGTYFQNVPLRSMRVDQAASTLELTREGHTQSLAFGKDFVAFADPGRSQSAVDAAVIFVGYGVTAPEQKYDDYKSIDVKGKIIAILPGAPNFESALRAHYSSSTVKAQNAAAHGAVGVMALDDPVQERSYAFSKFVRDLVTPQYRWLSKQGKPNDYYSEIKAAAFLSMATTENLFHGTGHTAEELFALAKEGKPQPVFALPATAKLHNVTQSQDVQGSNVVAKLEGSDPTLKNEYVVYTAHLDHIGIGEPVHGDTIYNGALDNASGCATLLEIARAFSGMNPKPRRSLLFVLVTGEEAGLLGSDYFASNSTVPANSMVADVNVDEVLMLWPLADIVAFGAEHSSLDAIIKKAADRMHLVVSPDPLPEEVVFIRSDQYSFVKQGVPAVMPSPGFHSADPKLDPMKIFLKWEEQRYHQPQDDIDQPGLDFDAAARFARFALLCGYLITEQPQRPLWNKGDFFGDHYSHAAH